VEPAVCKCMVLSYSREKDALVIHRCSICRAAPAMYEAIRSYLEDFDATEDQIRDKMQSAYKQMVVPE